MTASFRNATTGQDVELSVKGDMFGMGSVISLNGTQPVAQISRQYMNGRQWIGGQQTVSVGQLQSSRKCQLTDSTT